MTHSENYYYSMISDEERAHIPYLETIPALVEKCAEDFGDQTALVDDTQTLTYRQLRENRLLTGRES